MKKILTILFMAFIFPLAVSADMGVPTIRGYDAVVTNTKGAKVTCYNNNDEEKKLTIPYDTKIKVDYEYSGIEAYVTYKKMSCSISVEDISASGETYEITDEEKTYQTETALVIGKKGVNIYNGPSTAFDKIGQIPYNTKINFDYAIDSYFWVYVEYKGVKGWISTLDGEVVIKQEESVIIITDTDFYNEKNEVVTIIPKLTELKNVYFYNFFYKMDFDKSYYFTYNNVNGFIGDVEVGRKLEKKEKLVLEFDAPMYKNFEDEKELIIIPKGTVLEYEIFYGNTWEIYTSYEGYEGWVDLSGPDEDDEEYYDDEYEDEEYYDDEYEDEEYYDDEYEDEVDEQTEEPLKPVEEKKKIRGKDFVILCVGGAIVVALTAVVTIILINKNKKKNVKAVVEEVQPVEMSTPVEPVVEPTPVEPVVEPTPVEEVKQEEKIDSTTTEDNK